ncbi:MAG: signal recognition particle-docking protein FtsY [candidate division Zixibacteria bacterium]|nr:signal recognition particle-docking protein FtsY [candidate division Zixibacteria bacterium]
MGFSFKKLAQGLLKTKENLVTKLKTAVGLHKKVDAELLAEIEEILISSDISVETAEKLIEGLKEKVAKEGIDSSDDVYRLLKDCLVDLFEDNAHPFFEVTDKPHVIMIVGVNGTGKTTSIAKIARRFKNDGKRVTMVAADTFRAAAIDQLAIWAERVGCNLVKGQEGGDSASVAFDSINAARARGDDLVIIDTAGRLHTKANLMEELSKVKRVIKKALPEAPHRTLLVVDGTTGQNALQQVETFNRMVQIDGIIVTKLDGTAKGGAVFSIVDKFQLPVVLIGIGEKMDDLDEFKPRDFVEALFT